jgi:hypothetical protein
MQKVAGYIFFMIAGICCFAGCVKQENYPDVPQIEYQDFVYVFNSGQYADSGFLKISFTDGNGDIGLNRNDTFPPFNKSGSYYYNYIINYFEKQQGVFVDKNTPFRFRIPVLNSEFPGKPIKGVISVKLDFTLNPHLFDTIKFEAFIYDRALNKSNVISTPEIILKRP